jgi:hypothetical protein
MRALGFVVVIEDEEVGANAPQRSPDISVIIGPFTFSLVITTWC